MTATLNTEEFRSRIFNYLENQEWNYAGERPVVIDFWAPWCGPCRALSPLVDELSTEYAGKVDFYKVNTDEEQELAGVFGIRSIPSLLFIPKEGTPRMAVGALPKDELERIIGEVLLANGSPETK